MFSNLKLTAFKNRVKNLKITILNFIFPNWCISCKRGGLVICEDCFSNIPLEKTFFKDVYSFYSYKNYLVDMLLWKLKYHHNGDVANVFGKTIARELVHVLNNVKNIVFIPIPLTVGDRRIHNHATLLAESISENLQGYKVEVVENVLIKQNHKKQAHTHSRAERFENMSGAFTVNELTVRKIQNKKTSENLFVLIDDVTTTGATIDCAKGMLAKKLNISKKDIFAVTVAH